MGLIAVAAVQGEADLAEGVSGHHRAPQMRQLRQELALGGGKGGIGDGASIHIGQPAGQL